ncbi:MAG: DUF1295 domain-containing protein, partial [Candidatus Micrarchaeota archaeon]|nr:DUF1295 domain-containing protein [Candidatus Micrarchaeota archaeon]
ALLGAAALTAFVPAVPVFRAGMLTDVAAAFLLLNWIGFFALSLWHHPDAEKSAAAIKKLQTQGTYAIMRHPIYFADMGLTIGIFLYMPFLNVLASAAFVVAVLYFWAGLEEEALLRKFGRRYSEYCKKVPKFIPRTI